MSFSGEIVYHLIILFFKSLFMLRAHKILIHMGSLHIMMILEKIPLQSSRK